MCSEILPISNTIDAEGLNNMQTADIDELMREKPLYENNLNKIMTVDDSEEVHNDRAEVKFSN